MISKTTANVRIDVETFYQPDYSNPLQREFMYAYRVTIHNHNAFAIQLQKRHWFINDGTETRDVEGEGVIGLLPVMQPGEHFQYVSGANIHNEWGRMMGYYTMLNLQTKQPFAVKIPAFILESPMILN